MHLQCTLDACLASLDTVFMVLWVKTHHFATQVLGRRHVLIGFSDDYRPMTRNMHRVRV